MNSRMRTTYHCRWNKVYSPKFLESYELYLESEEDQMVQWLKCCDSNNQDEDAHLSEYRTVKWKNFRKSLRILASLERRSSELR